MVKKGLSDVEMKTSVSGSKGVLDRNDLYERTKQTLWVGSTAGQVVPWSPTKKSCCRTETL